MKYKCLSIVSPSGTRIANGEKTLEIRSWKPNLSPEEDLLIIENNKFLKLAGETDPDGTAVALVKIRTVREYLEEDIPAACASSWSPGYYSWELYDVRPIISEQKILAAREIYEIDIDL